MSRHTGAFVYTGSGKKHSDDAPIERRPEVSVGLGRLDAEAEVRHHHRERVHVGQLALRHLVANHLGEAAAPEPVARVPGLLARAVAEIDRLAPGTAQEALLELADQAVLAAPCEYRCGVLHAIGATAPDIHAQAGLGAWWNKMLKTKAVAALKGKGKKLMPGEHNKAW